MGGQRGHVPVVFFHVMKCGGTSVRAGLATGVAGVRSGPSVFELDGQAAIRAVGGNDQDNWRFRDALLPYAVRVLEPAIVLGHFRYRDRYRDELDLEADFVTVLRDPVDRVVSLYKYRRYKADVDVRVSMPFEEFLASKRWQREGHAYVDVFRGRDDLDPRSDEAVAAAVANLERFAVVGFLDRLDEFAAQVSSRAGRHVEIPMLNRSPAPEDEGISEEAMALARQICEPDRRVYEQVLAARGRAEAPAGSIG